MLRVNVAAAPGTGVASAPRSVEQLAFAIAATNAISPKPRRIMPGSIGARVDALAQVVPQLLGSAGVAQLAQRFGFDLADALTRDAKLAAHLFQGALAAVVQAEA